MLFDVSFAAEAGELLALIGPNGAGKTSLFNSISGIYEASGSIRFRGQDLLGRKPYEIAALGMARTFQHAELLPQMSVIDNVLVADLADRILVLDAGRTIALGSPQEVLRNDAVIRAYLGVATQP